MSESEPDWKGGEQVATMSSMKDAEQLLANSPAPSVRAGPHRNVLRAELISQFREKEPTAGRSTWVRHAPSRLWWAVAAAIFVAGTITFVLLTNRDRDGLTLVTRLPTDGARVPSPEPEPAAKLLPLAVESVARPLPTTVPHDRVLSEERLSRKSLDENVAEAKVIFVGTALDFAPAPPMVKGDAPENLIRYRVLRVVKGELKDQIVFIRTPTAPAEFVGRDWVIMLSPEFVVGQHKFAGTYTITLEPQIKALVDKQAKPAPR